MTFTRTQTRIAVSAIFAAALLIGAGQVLADNTGRTGRTQSTTGCSCHGSTQTPGVTVAITGPQAVITGSTNPYTVTVSGGPVSPSGGFNLKGSGGTFVAGANNHVAGLEVTHSIGTLRSWTFSWTAPATAGPQNFLAIALAADGGDDTSADEWNYYGGAMNTQFVINVAAAAGVGDTPSLTWIAPPLPNPCRNGTRISFSLADAGNVQLTLMDAAGRRVRTLASGTMAAGRQSVPWDGRMEDGARAAAGVYFVRLTTPQRELSTRINVVD